MRYDYNSYIKLEETIKIVYKYAYEMRIELDDYKDIIENYLNDTEVICRLDIIATEIIIKQKKEMMIRHIDIYYDICKALRYPNIKSCDDFNPEFIGNNKLPKDFDIGLLEVYDRLLMRAMLEALPENNNKVSVSLDLAVTEKELQIKNKLLKFGSEHYFDILHAQGIPTILS